MFVDAREKRVKDARALMNLQNNRAGRRVGHYIISQYNVLSLTRFLGSTSAYDIGMQMSWCQWCMHNQDMLVGVARVLQGWILLEDSLRLRETGLHESDGDWAHSHNFRGTQEDNEIRHCLL